MRNIYFVLPSLVFFGFGCASSSKMQKVILDESGSKPSWVEKSRTTWDENDKVFLKSTQQVRGNERVSACYDLAKLNSKSNLIAEIQESIKGILDSHEASLSENAEILLNKSRSSEFAGKISGLRFTEEYFARYTINGDERIDCYELSEISRDDYNKIKRVILYKLEEVDPRVKEQVTKKHLDFFSQTSSPLKSE